MNITFCASLVLFVCYLSEVLSSSIHRIVNGEGVDIKDYPYVVSVQKRLLESSDLYYHLCGGTIVSATSVLTAAHCLVGTSSESDTWRYRIQAGSTYLSAGFEAYGITKMLIHPNYNESNFDYDFAIMRLANSFQYKDGIAAISYAPIDYGLDDNTAVTVLGWGRLEVGGANPDNLQAAEVYVVNQQTCATNYTYLNSVTDSMVCAGTPSSSALIKDSCSGDSGGPLVHQSILVGLVSWGYRCAEPTYPGVYSRISTAFNWISENIL